MRATLVALAVFVSACSASTPAAEPGPSSPAATASAPAPVATVAPQPDFVLTAADQGKQTDKGWVLETYKASGNSGLIVVARITNAHSAVQSGVFTMTLLDGATVVATYQGSAQGIAPRQTVTVELGGDTALRPGSKATRFEFQTDQTFRG